MVDVAVFVVVVDSILVVGLDVTAVVVVIMASVETRVSPKVNESP